MNQSYFSLGFLSQNSLWKLSQNHGYKGIYICKVEFIQPSCWLYSVPNLLVFQQLVILYLGRFVVKVVSEIEC